MRRLRVLTGDTYVIGMRCRGVVRKLFQIIPASDGSLYVTFPYLPFASGMVGILTVPAGPDRWLLVEDFPITTHHVKYAHHPSGRAHFSQSGRVKNTVGKASIPFSRMSGHIFSVSFQGIERYEADVLDSKQKRGRGIVVFPFDGAGTYKFVAHIHSATELEKMVTGTGTTLWLNCVAPSGRLVRGITLQTKFRDMRGPRYLLLYVEPEQEICAQYEEFLLFMGGFDPPEISLDRSKETRALMFLYPLQDCTPELLQRVGTIDLA